jgi:uncharacterized protein with HEPN domain
MPRHDADVRLRHMLDAGREGVRMVQGKTRADLDADRPLNLSLARLLEIVGEAAFRAPARERAKYPGISWAQIVGLPIGSSTATTMWTLTSSGKSSPKTYRR